MALLKNKLKNNRLLIGSWITLADTAIAEIMAKSGFDWLVVDMEHSAITLPEAQELIRIIELAGCVPLVRVGENNPFIIKRVMDAGSGGIIVPMVNSKNDAIKAVSACKYPPVGERGVGLARAQGYGLGFEKYKKWLEKESLVIVQIEHIEAINNIEEILNVEGVDASIIGPYDLSASLGHPGDFDRKEIKNAIANYIKACDKSGKPAGTHVIAPDGQEANRRIKEGFKFIAFSMDALFLAEKIKSELIKIKK